MEAVERCLLPLRLIKEWNESQGAPGSLPYARLELLAQAVWSNQGTIE